MFKEYLIKIIILLFFTYLVSCNNSKDNTTKVNTIRELKSSNKVINDTLIQKRIKKNKNKNKKDSIIIIPDEYDNFSEVILYYESYIDKAYSKKIYKKYFSNNRLYLDTLIEKYESLK